MRFEYLTPKILGFYAIVIISFISIVIFSELSNVTNSSMELAYIMRKCMEESCKFYSQESYLIKDSDNGNIVRGNAYNILDKYGNNAVSGLFYDSNSYKDMICGTEAHNYLAILDSVISKEAKKNNSYTILKKLMYDDNDNDTNYIKYGITPANLGFTYLHSATLAKIFKWRLTNELTSTGIDYKDYRQRNTILKDEMGKQYILWKGFRIYLDNIKVYTQADNRVRVLHITDQGEDWEIFSDWTGVTKNYLYDDNGNELIKDTDIRSYKVLYDVRWKIDIGYEGILPLYLVMNVFRGKENVTANVAGQSYESLVQVREGDKDEDISTLGGAENNKLVWSGTFGDKGNTYRFDDSNGSDNIDGTFWSGNQTLKLAQRTKFIIIH